MSEEQNLQAVEPVEVQVIDNAASLAALNKSEIDVQVATAKRYPRNLSQVLNNIETLATMDEDTAPRAQSPISGDCIWCRKAQKAIR